MVLTAVFMPRRLYSVRRLIRLKRQVDSINTIQDGPFWGQHFYERIYHNLITSILQGIDQKNHFFEEWSWLKLNILGLSLGMALRLYTSVAKRLKLTDRKFLGLIPTFVEVTGKKLVGGGVGGALKALLNVRSNFVVLLKTDTDRKTNWKIRFGR